MNKLVEFLIAAFFFIVIVFFLIPMLPVKIGALTLVVVIFFAIIFCLGEMSGYPWPWRK